MDWNLYWYRMRQGQGVNRHYCDVHYAGAIHRDLDAMGIFLSKPLRRISDFSWDFLACEGRQDRLEN
jgi:hypothetical protein